MMLLLVYPVIKSNVPGKSAVLRAQNGPAW